MKILHVSLGLPPFRTGGLNRYCADLMAEQVKCGDTVGLLYPAEFTPTEKTKIKKTEHKTFDLYRVINPLPVALTNGISAPSRYIKACGEPKVYRDFLCAYRPDVIHVHSFQGIHREFFEAAHEMGIRMVFTTHDFYPFCPTCVLLHRDGSICSGAGSEKCSECNVGRGLSVKQEIIMQSRLYEKLKYSAVMKKIRGNQRKKNAERASDSQNAVCTANESEYTALKEYYADIFGLMDVVHCNSESTRDVYRQVFPDADYRTVCITHSGIKKTTHEKSENTLRIGFVGGLASHKGLDVLLRAVKILDEKGTAYELYLYGADFSEYASANEKIHNGGVYTRENEDSVWKSFDILVVPSEWHETFGLVVPEALARGLRVICSDLVGAKQMLRDTDVFPHGSASELAERILSDSIQPEITEDALSMEKHAQTIKNTIYTV